MNKKALELSRLALILITILGFTVIAAASTRLFMSLAAETPEQACRLSVVARANLQFEEAGIEVTNIYPLNCKTQDKLLPEETSSKAYEDQVKQEIADLMADCWWMFGDGFYHDILDQSNLDQISGAGHRCHVCYSFVVQSEDELSIPIEDLTLYLAETSYQPSFLESGLAVRGGFGIYEFTPQEVSTLVGREQREFSEEDIFDSKRLLDRGLVDLAGLYEGELPALTEIRLTLSELIAAEVEPAFIVVPSVPQEYREEDGLAFQVLDEWGIGATDLDNGMVFIFSLSDGKLLYATGKGADGIFPKHFLDDLFEITLAEEMELKNPIGALQNLADGMKDSLLESSDNLREEILFQRSYLAYLTGGEQGSSVSADINEDAIAQGGLYIQKGTEEIVASERYAIMYISPLWNGCRFILPSLCGDDETPNMIGLAKHEDLFATGTDVCNVHAEDG